MHVVVAERSGRCAILKVEHAHRRVRSDGYAENGFDVVLLDTAPIAEALIEERRSGDHRLAAGHRFGHDSVGDDVLDLFDVGARAADRHAPA